MESWKALNLSILLGIASLASRPCTLLASPLFPAVRASSSMNGRYLVIVEQTFKGTSSMAVGRVPHNTYLVLRSEPFTNSRDRLQSTASFWSDFGWQISPTGNASEGIFLPLITNDGLTVVLVRAEGPMKFGNQDVMLIYRKQSNTARLVRSVPLSDIWTHEEIEANAVLGDSGATPMWYTGGSFEFSPDDRLLLYHSRWNDTIAVNLADGLTTIKRK